MPIQVLFSGWLFASGAVNEASSPSPAGPAAPSLELRHKPAARHPSGGVTFKTVTW